MAKILDRQRFKCALGAMQSVQAISRAIPVLHSGPGCAQKLCDNTGSSGYLSPNIFPCTSINEKDVVFGGVKKLHSTIENALRVLDGDLFVVLTGCIPEIVGDDSGEVVSEFDEEKQREIFASIGGKPEDFKYKPVVFASTAGFKGNNYRGHEQVIDAIITQYLKKSDKRIPGLVNVWADVPYQDLFWQGNLRELESLLTEIGLTPNVIFGYNKGLKNIDLIPQAQFNLLVSPWVSLKNVKKMETKLGLPYLHCPVLPVGAHETSNFLRKVAAFAGVDQSLVEAVIAKHENYYFHLIERYADLFLENRVINKEFSVVGDAQYTLAITRFLVNDFGLIPATQFVVYDTPKEYQEAIRAEFEHLDSGLSAKVLFENDGYKIEREIRGHDYHGYPLILGSYYEKELTASLNGNFLNIAWPFQDRVVIDINYVGYSGGIRLIEDIYTVAVQRFN